MEVQNVEIDYIPVPKKNQLIVPYDFKYSKYDFKENDMRLLLKYFPEKQVLQLTVKELQTKKSLNPFKNSCKKMALKGVLWFFHLLFLFLFVYMWIGLLLFLLGDPVILVLYGYFVIYQLWYRIMRLGIEVILDFGKSRPLQNYLKSMNKKHFGPKRVEWSVGGGGKWIQIDYLKHFKK